KALTRCLFAVAALSASAAASSVTASCAVGRDGDEKQSPDASDEIDLDISPTPVPTANFPAKPFVDPALPPGVPGLFGADAPGGTGPCMTEPPIDAMFPKNWTPPLFEWTGAPGQNVFELRVHVDNQVNDLVVYTKKTSFTMPGDLWAGLALNSAGH